MLSSKEIRLKLVDKPSNDLASETYNAYIDGSLPGGGGDIDIEEVDELINRYDSGKRLFEEYKINGVMEYDDQFKPETVKTLQLESIYSSASTPGEIFYIDDWTVREYPFLEGMTITYLGGDTNNIENYNVSVVDCPTNFDPSQTWFSFRGEDGGFCDPRFSNDFVDGTMVLPKGYQAKITNKDNLTVSLYKDSELINSQKANIYDYVILEGREDYDRIEISSENKWKEYSHSISMVQFYNLNHFYVDYKLSDNGDGTSNSPFNNLQSVFEKIQNQLTSIESMNLNIYIYISGSARNASDKELKKVDFNLFKDFYQWVSNVGNHVYINSSFEIYFEDFGGSTYPDIVFSNTTITEYGGGITILCNKEYTDTVSNYLEMGFDNVDTSGVHLYNSIENNEYVLEEIKAISLSIKTKDIGYTNFSDYIKSISITDVDNKNVDVKKNMNSVIVRGNNSSVTIYPEVTSCPVSSDKVYLYVDNKNTNSTTSLTMQYGTNTERTIEIIPKFYNYGTSASSSSYTATYNIKFVRNSFLGCRVKFPYCDSKGTQSRNIAINFTGDTQIYNSSLFFCTSYNYNNADSKIKISTKNMVNVIETVEKK